MVEGRVTTADSTGGCNTLKTAQAAGSVANEIATADLLQREAESADVGTLTEGRISPEDRAAF
jgi:hypothetical protein